MDVSKVQLSKDQALFGRCYFVGAVFYITRPYRRFGSTDDRSDLFDESGELLGTFSGNYFDFGDKKVFERVDA